MDKTSLYDYLAEWMETEESNKIPMDTLIGHLNDMISDLSESGLDEFDLFPIVESEYGSCNGWIHKDWMDSNE